MRLICLRPSFSLADIILAELHFPFAVGWCGLPKDASLAWLCRNGRLAMSPAFDG